MTKKIILLILIALLMGLQGPVLAATGSNYPTTLDSWVDKITGDFLTVADVNQRSSAIEKLEAGPLRLNDGTAAAPAYAFRTSATAGFFMSAANQIDLSTASTARWRWNASGHYLAVSDNSFDIGASGANRPRDLFLARNALLDNTGPVLTLSAADAQIFISGSSDPGWTVQALMIGSRQTIYPSSSGNARFSYNSYQDAVGTKYIVTDGSAAVDISSQAVSFVTAASGTAGTAITYVTGMTLSAAGGITVGAAPTGGGQVAGTINMDTNYYADGTAGVVGPVTCTTVTSITVKMGLVTAIAGAGC